MPEYRCVSGCGWGSKSWRKGDTFQKSDVPPEVFDVLQRRGAVAEAPPEPDPEPVKSAKPAKDAKEK